MDLVGEEGPVSMDQVTAVRAISQAWMAGHATDPGLKRRDNEDACLAEALGPVPGAPGVLAGLFLVADGMGGAAAGEIASRMAIDGIAGEFSRSLGASVAKDGAPDWESIFTGAVQHANREIFAARRSAGNDMGTTLVGAVVADGRAIVVNVGDSRAYHISRSEIRQITKDHSLVQGLADRGDISREEMRTHPQRNLILRSLGGQADVNIDVYHVDLARGEWLLLCSDGLWEMASEDQIHEIVLKGATPAPACQELIGCANKNGGDDNVTAVLVQQGNIEVRSAGGER